MPLYCLKFKEGGDEYTPVFYKDGQELTQVSDGAGDTFYTYQPLYTSKALLSELYYRNKAKHVYADYDTNKIKLGDTVDDQTLEIQDISIINGIGYIEDHALIESVEITDEVLGVDYNVKYNDSGKLQITGDNLAATVSISYKKKTI